MEYEELDDPRLFRLPRDFDKHHSFWPRRAYTGRFEKQFRTLSGLIVPGPIDNHRLLHARLEPPRKPNNRMMVDLRDILNNTPPAIQQDRLWGLNQAQEYFQSEADVLHSPEIAELAQDLADHMAQQIGFLSLKLVSRVA
jgi:hypothetical protein